MKRALLTILFLQSDLGFASGLCRSDETDFFTCQAPRDGKIVSVCGHISDADPKGEDSWLQYRFGTRRHVELTYPIDRSSSLTKFEGANFSHYGVVALRFIHKTAFYELTLASEYYGEEAIERKVASGGVIATDRGRTTFKTRCHVAEVKHYYESFTNLATTLEVMNGQGNIMSSLPRGGSRPK